MSQRRSSGRGSVRVGAEGLFFVVGAGGEVCALQRFAVLGCGRAIVRLVGRDGGGERGCWCSCCGASSCGGGWRWQVGGNMCCMCICAGVCGDSHAWGVKVLCVRWWTGHLIWPCRPASPAQSSVYFLAGRHVSCVRQGFRWQLDC